MREILELKVVRVVEEEGIDQRVHFHLEDPARPIPSLVLGMDSRYSKVYGVGSTIILEKQTDKGRQARYRLLTAIDKQKV